MKWNNSMRSAALLALIGSITGLGAAHAAVVADPQNGDLFIGFRASGGTGAQISYLVDIGQDSIYRNAASGTSFDLTVGNLAADLAATYGSNWNTRTDLTWGIFGVRTSASSTVYASSDRLDPAVTSTAWPALDLGGRNSTGSQISSVVDGTNGYRSRDASVNVATAVFQPNSSTSSSYAFQVGSAGTSDFGTLSQWGSIEGNFDPTTGSGVLDLYRISGSATTPVQDLGSFSLSNTGTVSFTAVPEVETTLLMALGTGMLVTVRRRNFALA